MLLSSHLKLSWKVLEAAWTTSSSTMLHRLQPEEVLYHSQLTLYVSLCKVSLTDLQHVSIISLSFLAPNITSEEMLPMQNANTMAPQRVRKMAQARSCHTWRPENDLEGLQADSPHLCVMAIVIHSRHRNDSHLTGTTSP